MDKNSTASSDQRSGCRKPKDPFGWLSFSITFIITIPSALLSIRPAAPFALLLQHSISAIDRRFSETPQWEKMCHLLILTSLILAPPTSLRDSNIFEQLILLWVQPSEAR